MSEHASVCPLDCPDTCSLTVTVEHAKIVKIDTAKALAIPGVLAVITGQDLAKYNLHWMPTLMSDTQMVLPVEKVMYQAQEVAAVLATERYIAADGADAVEVSYEPLPVVVDPKKALEPGAPVLADEEPAAEAALDARRRAARVRHELARIHDGFGLFAELGSGLHGGAQHVARGNLRNLIPVFDVVGLGAFSRPRAAQQN